MDQIEKSLLSAEPTGAPLPVDGVLEQSIRAIDIPPRPEIIDRIRAETNRETPCFRRIGDLIKADVALAAGLIKTVNSPYFGFRRRVRSVQDALLMLGLDVTSRAIAAISLRRAFPNSGHYVRFWDASARIAALSGWLAQQVDRPGLRSDDAYTFGLFHDCGIVILLRRFPDYMGTLSRANHEAVRAFTAIEHEEFPTDHTVLGSLLAQNWWLPDEICQGIRHHHDRLALDRPESGLPLASRYLIATSQIAERLLQDLTGASQTQEWCKLGASCLNVLGLDEVALRELHPEARSLLQAID